MSKAVRAVAFFLGVRANRAGVLVIALGALIYIFQNAKIERPASSTA